MSELEIKPLSLSILLDSQNRTTIVLAALLADTVGKARRTAARAQADFDTLVTVRCMTNSNLTLADFALLNSHGS